VATGAVQGNWTNRFFKFGVHHYADGTWASNVPENTQLFQGVNAFGGAINDVMAVAIDTKDKGRAFAGSWDEGLIEYRDRVPVTIHNSTNSGLQVETNNPEGKVNIAGLAFDRDGNLWITNAITSAPIKVLTADGEWFAFSPGSILNGNFLMSDILAARNGYKWVIRPRGQGLRPVQIVEQPGRQRRPAHQRCVCRGRGPGGPDLGGYQPGRGRVLCARCHFRQR
jgi:hypothetical protein